MTSFGRLDCDSAEVSLTKVELYLEKILVDMVAYYAEQFEQNPTNGDIIAGKFTLATTLHPLMRGV